MKMQGIKMTYLLTWGLGVLTLKNETMNTMLANDFQALLFIYINNKLVGGTPLLDLWHNGGYVALIFFLIM
jgi:hypothetical protein